MASLIFAINDYMVIEYTYKNGVNDEIMDTNRQKFQLIQNNYTGFKTLINDGRYQNHKTGNIQDNTAVIVDNGSIVYLDNDGRSFPDYDANISVTQVTFPSLKYVTYESVKLHILAGYNFQDAEGAMVSVYCKTASGKPGYLCNFVYLKSGTENIYFNQRPLKLSDKIYDKYVEVKIPSFAAMLEDQISGGGSSFFNDCFGEDMMNQNIFYCEVVTIESQEFNNGFRYMYIGEPKRFSLESTDQYNLLSVGITEKGTYFELVPTWGGGSIEDFIFGLNSLAGNKYILIHEVRVFEQYGATFVQTADLSFIQTDNYAEPFLFRPILRNPTGGIYAFSVDYTIRLLNQQDGKSIFANGSLTSTSSHKYSKENLSINVGNTHEPIKVYNQIIKHSATIIDSGSVKIQNKLVVYVVDKKNITFKTANTATADTPTADIVFSPFVSVVRFDVTDAAGSPADISYLSNPVLCVPRENGSKIYIKEFIDSSFDKTKGTLVFKLDSNTYNLLKQITTKKYYILNIGANGEEVELFNGAFTLS